MKKEEKVLLLNFNSCIIIKADEKIIKNFFQNKKINLLMKGGEFMKKKAAKKVVKKVAKKPAKRVVKKVAKKVVKKAVRKVAKKPARKAAKRRK